MFSRTKFSLILCLVILFISACTIQNETTRSGNSEKPSSSLSTENSTKGK